MYQYNVYFNILNGFIRYSFIQANTLKIRKITYYTGTHSIDTNFK